MNSQNKDKSFNKTPLFSRVLKWISGILFFFIISSFLFIYIFLDPIVKNRIIRAVHKSSEGMYVLQIGDLDAKFWSGAITMNEVWLKPDVRQLNIMRSKDTSAYIPNVNIHFDSVNISSIGWIKYLLNRKKLEIGKVIIGNPDFIIHGKASASESIKEGDRNFLDLLPGLIAAFTGSLRIEEMVVQDGHLHYDIHAKKEIVHQFADSVYINLKKIIIDTVSSKQALYSETASLDFRNYRLSSSDNLTSLSISHVFGTVNDSLLNMNGIHFYQRDSLWKNNRNGINISMKSLNTRGVDYGQLFKEKKIFFRTMILKSPDVYLQSSEDPVKKYSENNKDAEGLLEAVVPYLASTFRIDTLSILDGSIKYSIKNDKQKIIQSAKDIYLGFSRVLVDTTSGSKVYVEDMEIDLKNYSLLKDNTSKLYIASLKASVGDSLFYLREVDFSSEDNKGEDYFLKVKAIEAKGMDFLTMFKEKKVKMNDLIINSPELKINLVNEKNINKNKRSGADLFKNIMGPFSDASLNTKKLMIIEADVYHSMKTDSGQVEQKANNVFMTFDEVLIDSSSSANSDFFNSFYMGLENYELKVHSENFFINIKNIESSSKKSFIKMNGIVLSQIHSFGEGQRHYFIDSIESVYAACFDFDRLIKKQEVHSKYLYLDNMYLKIFLEGGKVQRPDFSHRMPQELLKKVGFYLRIDTLNFKNSYIVYEDQEPGKKQARLTFEKTSLNISNLTNDPTLMTDSTPANIFGSTLLMGEGLLEFHIFIPLLSPGFDAHYGGNMHEMNGNSFNDFFAFAGVQLKSGKILPSTFDVDIINGSASGQLKLVYEDLHIKVLDEKSGKPLKIKSVLGNAIVKNNNPNDKDEDPEVVKVASTREPDDSFFFFLWRVLKDGIIDTVTKSSLYSVSN